MPRWPEHDPAHKLPSKQASTTWWAQHRRRQARNGRADNPRDPLDTPLGRALEPVGASTALTRFMGRSKETISRWKSGQSQPILEDVPRIAHALAILHEQGLCGPPPSVLEILYPFGFPDGCERAVAAPLWVKHGALPEDPPQE